MVKIDRKTRVLTGIAPDAIPYGELIDAQEPVILRGIAADWPLVQAGLRSKAEAIAYLEGYDRGRPVVAYTAEPELKGRFFYNEDLTRPNFAAERVGLTEYLGRMKPYIGQDDGPSFYIGSTDADIFLPGFRKEHDLVLNHPMFEADPPMVSLWIGTRTVATCHYDMSYNVACCLVGKRRFTLFPPDQVANLYPGPLEPTPGGQVVSMVNFEDPEYDLYPNFREAEAVGQVAEMEPGDILIYPALWWHHVEALDDFNVMMNYWWNLVPKYIDTPMNTLLYGLMSLRDRPQAEKDSWKALFDYYVFGPADLAGAHLPEHARGNLGPMNDIKARMLRATLLKKLNR